MRHTSGLSYRRPGPGLRRDDGLVRLLRSSQYTPRSFVARIDRKWYRALEPRREIERLGQHQPIVRLLRRSVLRRQAHREPVQPLLGFLAHRAAQLAKDDVARRIAAEKIDATSRVGGVPFVLRKRGGEHDIAV